MAKKLPKFLYDYFWDTNPAKIDLIKNSPYVIKRLLKQNNLKATKWVLGNFPRQKIIETIKSGRGFTSKEANFWRLYFKIPEKQVRCLQKQSHQPPVRIWPH